MILKLAHVSSPVLSFLCRSAALLPLCLLLLLPVAAHAQDGSGGQGDPPGQQQDPDGPGDDDDDDDNGSNNPEEEGSEPVFLTASVSPARVPVTSGTATVTWEAENARYCTVDGVARATSGSITVGPWTTAGAKSILIECYNNGKAGYAADSLTVTVYNVPKPVITTTLSKSLLEANVDKFTVTYSATNAKSCMFAGTKYPISGSATLGPYPVGKHSLTFSCSGDGGSTSHTINWEAITAVTLSSSVSPTTVKANGSETARVSWTGAHADSCTLDGANAAKSGSKDFGPYSYSEAGSKSATVACKNRLGSKTSTVNWTVNALAPSVSAALSQNPVVADVDTVNLSWTSSDSDYCSYGGSRRGVNGTVSNLGPFSAGNHSFTVSCTGTGGTGSDTVTLTAEEPAPPPTVAVSLDPDTITAGTGTSTLKWESEHATSCSRNNSTVATSGSARVGPYPRGSQTFTINCAGPGGSANGNATLTVEPPPDPPTVQVTLSPTRVPVKTGTSTLTWSSENASSCSRDGTTLATVGKESVGPFTTAGTHRFTVSCAGPGGTASETARLTVTAAADPDTDGDGTVDSIDTDDDNDGMPDACEIRYGFNPLDASDGGSANSDGDGASNAHECKHGTDPTRTPAETILPDTDGDGMFDAWEWNHGLDPDDADDRDHDQDGDGYTNFEEYTARTDPRWDASHPKSVPELSSGFNDSYTVHVGQINAGDMLKDILVRNPTKNILPAISDFVLIQRKEGGFDLKDADDFTIPNNLTDIGGDAEFVDINADGATDLVITGLGGHVAGASDRVVYGNVHERHTIPTRHVGLAPETRKFFKELGAWIDDDKYFIKNAKKVSLPKVIGLDFLRDSENRIIARRIGGRTETPARSGASDETCFEGTCPPAGTEQCETLGSFFCTVYRGDLSDLSNINSGNDPCASAEVVCTLYANPNAISVTDAKDDPDEDNYDVFIKVRYSPTVKVTVRDFSGFNQDAWLLATRMLQPLRADNAVLTPGTRQAEVISRTLEAYLDAPVLNNRLLGVGNGVLPQVADPDDYDGDSAEILESMEFVRDKITLPAPQNQVTDAEREDSPNKDVTEGLLRCTYNVPCYPDDYTPRQKLDINSRLEELLLPLASATYSATDEAAIAIHDSQLHMFARELGIEVLITIDDMVNPVQITNVSTSFNTGFVGIPSDSYGKSIWHNHPGPFGVWQGDAASYVNGFGSDICNQERDFTVYASTSSLSKASVKQVIGIADKSSFKFSASVYSKEDSMWESRTYNFRDDADEVNVSCSSN